MVDTSHAALLYYQSMQSIELARSSPRSVRLDPKGMLLVRNGPQAFVYCLGQPFEITPHLVAVIAGERMPDPEHTVLLELRSIPNYVVRRARYVQLLKLGLDEALSEDDAGRLRRLSNEYSIWRRLDMADVDRAFAGWLFASVEVALEHPDRCWLWGKPPHPRRRPSVNWHYHKGLPVLRILWPYVKPLEPIPSDHYPVPLQQFVGATRHRMCVNPLHYEIATGDWGYDLQDGTGRGHRDDVKTGRNMAWTYDLRQNAVVCVASGHRLAERYQQDWEQNTLKRKVDCDMHKEIWARVHLDRRVRVGRKAIPDDIKGVEMLREGHQAVQAALDAQWVEDAGVPPDPYAGFSPLERELIAIQEAQGRPILTSEEALRRDSQPH